MTEACIYWICEAALFVSGILYMYGIERREFFGRKLSLWILGYLFLGGCINWILPENLMLPMHILFRAAGLGFLVLMQHTCFRISWSLAVYQSIWAFMSWQMFFELWVILQGSNGLLRIATAFDGVLSLFLIFLIGEFLVAAPLARLMLSETPVKIGPRQLSSAMLIFGTFEMISLVQGNVKSMPGEWQVQYLSQLLLAIILYLQNELFKKSAMRQELTVMNMLWKKEQEQYQLSKENIALINQKCHDLKHQIRAIRYASKEDVDRYLEEMEDSIRIYEAIVKTGNEVLDTILTEKSLYCKQKGIVVSCVADGSQMEFIHTVDLYAILGNALDNAMEAVEKFKHTEKRQIDVLIYRQQNFLVMNIINPIKGNLVYEEDLPVSTKGDNRFHGFGLRSMQYLVKKYDGYLSVSEEDGCFSLKILIPIPKTENS